MMSLFYPSSLSENAHLITVVAGGSLSALEVPCWWNFFFNFITVDVEIFYDIMLRPAAS